MKHSKEPWYNDFKDGFVQDNGGMNIATMYSTFISPETTKANAARIVVCINAMKGLTNEQVADIRSQNTELLEALIQIKSLCGKTYPTNEAIFEITNNAIKSNRIANQKNII